MKSKHLLLFAAAFSLVAVSSARSQMGVGMFKRPNIANIFHPVVGGGAAYERSNSDGQKSTMEMSIVGSEMVGAKQGYWMEFTHSGHGDKQAVSGKSLVTPDDFKFHKMVFMMPGSTQPVEMDMDASQSHRETMERDLDKWRSVGTETVTVPAGTFSCEHWTKDDGKGDVWVSSKVTPMGMVKSVDNGETMVLTKIITGAQSHITGTPVKFDPQMMRQQHQQKNQEKP